MSTLVPFVENLRGKLPLDRLRAARPDVERLKKRLQPRSALALTLEADHIAVSVVRLHLDDDGRDVIPVRSVPVGADDVFKHPEKAGGILAAALEAAGLREKRCAVCVPPAWALAASTDLPAVQPDDLRGYLELRAEREFPIALSELRLGHSPYTLPDGTRRATLAALPSRRVEAVETMLAAAGRRAVSVSLALGDTLAADGGDPAPTLHFLASPGHTDVVVTAGGGVAALRSLPGPAGDADKPVEGSSPARSGRAGGGLRPGGVCARHPHHARAAAARRSARACGSRGSAARRSPPRGCAARSGTRSGAWASRRWRMNPPKGRPRRRGQHDRRERRGAAAAAGVRAVRVRRVPAASPGGALQAAQHAVLPPDRGGRGVPHPAAGARVLRARTVRGPPHLAVGGDARQRRRPRRAATENPPLPPVVRARTR